MSQETLVILFQNGHCGFSVSSTKRRGTLRATEKVNPDDYFTVSTDLRTWGNKWKLALCLHPKGSGGFGVPFLIV